MEVLLLIRLGWGISLALGGEDVDHDRAVELGGVAQRLLEARDVVAVEGTAVTDAEGLEEDRRLEHLAQAGPGAGEAPGDVLADHGDLADDLLGPATLAEVAGVEAQARHAGRQAPDGGGVRPPVVVQDDDGATAGVAQVVQRFVGHAAGQGTVADHRDHVVALGDLALASGCLGVLLRREGQTMGIAHDRRRVAVLDPVVLGLVARVAGQVAAQWSCSNSCRPVTLVHVGEVAGVPEDLVGGRIEHPVERQGELDAEVGADAAAAGAGDGTHDEVPDSCATPRAPARLEQVGGQVISSNSIFGASSAGRHQAARGATRSGTSRYRLSERSPFAFLRTSGEGAQTAPRPTSSEMGWLRSGALPRWAVGAPHLRWRHGTRGPREDSG